VGNCKRVADDPRQGGEGRGDVPEETRTADRNQDEPTPTKCNQKPRAGNEGSRGLFLHARRIVSPPLGRTSRRRGKLLLGVPHQAGVFQGVLCVTTPCEDRGETGASGRGFMKPPQGQLTLRRCWICCPHEVDFIDVDLLGLARVWGKT
jgi:hypothetical protein